MSIAVTHGLCCFPLAGFATAKLPSGSSACEPPTAAPGEFAISWRLTTWRRARCWAGSTAAKPGSSFCSFLGGSGGVIPRAKRYTLLDNYSPHLKEKVWASARANNVKFYLTRSNASWLNQIECQFVGLKKFALDNSDYQSHEEQEQAIRRYLAWRNGRRAIAVEPWRSSLRRNTTSACRAAA